MHDHCIRNLKMLPEEWQKLEQLAIATNSHNTRGTKVYQPSWLAMIRRIARGELIVSEAKPNVHLQRLDAALAKHKADEEAHAKRVQAEYRQLDMLELESA